MSFRSPYGPSRPSHPSNSGKSAHRGRHGSQDRGRSYTSTTPAGPPLTADRIDALSETVRSSDLADALEDRVMATTMLDRHAAMVGKAKQAVEYGNTRDVEIPLIRIGFRDDPKAMAVSMPLLRSMGIRMPSSGMSRPSQHTLGDIAVELLPSIIVHPNPVCGLLGVIVPLPKERAV